MQQVDPAQLQPGSGVDVQRLTGQTFFPHLISGPFMHGLLIAFGASIVMLLIAAWASLMRGERFVHADAHDTPHHDTVAESWRARGRGRVRALRCWAPRAAYADALGRDQIRPSRRSLRSSSGRSRSDSSRGSMTSSTARWAGHSQRG